MTLKEKLFLEKACQAKQQNARYAAEVLAAQMPRLELYSTMNVSSIACKALPQQLLATCVISFKTRYFNNQPAGFLFGPSRKQPGTGLCRRSMRPACKRSQQQRPQLCSRCRS